MQVVPYSLNFGVQYFRPATHELL